MQVQKFQNVEATANFIVNQERVLLMPIGDIQYGKDCDMERLRNHILWGVQHDAYFIGMGDYVDFASPSNRAKLEGGEFYDSTYDTLEDAVTRQVVELYDEALAPSRGRWLGGVEGHHFYRFHDGKTTDDMLYEMLGCESLGKCALVGLEFPEGVVEIWLHHGEGGGQSVVSPINKLMGNHIPMGFQADIYLIGHHHKITTARPDRIKVNWKTGEMVSQSLLLASTGSFMRGYTQNRETPSYVENRMMAPVALGGIAITIKPDIRHGLFVPDIQVSS